MLTPQPTHAPKMKRKPCLGAIIGSNVIIFLHHMFGTPPSASESTRYYLNGGVFLDFIGQKSPVSIFTLMYLDIVIATLQIAMFAAQILRLQMKAQAAATGERRDSDGITDAAIFRVPVDTNDMNALPHQDTDSEEQGLLRATVLPSFESDDIEMHSLTSNPEPAEARAELSASFVDRSLESFDNEAHPLDAFYSGQAIIMDLHLFGNIRTQLREYQEFQSEIRSRLTSIGSGQRLGSSTTRPAWREELMRQLNQDPAAADLHIGG
jgi:hypothetical protein